MSWKFQAISPVQNLGFHLSSNHESTGLPEFIAAFFMNRVVPYNRKFMTVVRVVFMIERTQSNLITQTHDLKIKPPDYGTLVQQSELWWRLYPNAGIIIDRRLAQAPLQ